MSSGFVDPLEINSAIDEEEDECYSEEMSKDDSNSESQRRKAKEDREVVHAQINATR